MTEKSLDLAAYMGIALPVFAMILSWTMYGVNAQLNLPLTFVGAMIFILSAAYLYQSKKGVGKKEVDE